MTLQQAADHSQFGIDTVRKAMKEGRIKATRPEGKDIRISREAFLAWMDCKMETGPHDEEDRELPRHYLGESIRWERDPEDVVWVQTKNVSALKVSRQRWQLMLSVPYSEIKPGAVAVFSWGAGFFKGSYLHSKEGMEVFQIHPVVAESLWDAGEPRTWTPSPPKIHAVRARMLDRAKITGPLFAWVDGMYRPWITKPEDIASFAVEDGRMATLATAIGSDVRHLPQGTVVQIPWSLGMVNAQVLSCKDDSSNGRGMKLKLVVLSPSDAKTLWEMGDPQEFTLDLDWSSLECPVLRIPKFQPDWLGEVSSLSSQVLLELPMEVEESDMTTALTLRCGVAEATGTRTGYDPKYIEFSAKDLWHLAWPTVPTKELVAEIST